MEFRPILSALLRNKAGLILIGLQVALTLAIVTNALFIINDRLGKIGRPSGVDEANIFQISSLGFAVDFNNAANIDADLRLFRQMPGVKDAYASNTLPLTNGGWSSSVTATRTTNRQAAIGSAIYFADEHALNTLGSNLVAGRNFEASEINEFPDGSKLLPAVVVISEVFARKLFPDQKDLQSILGREIYFGDSEKAEAGSRVIGIVGTLQAPWTGWDDMIERTTLVPYRQVTKANTSRYVVRTLPGERDAVMKQVEDKLLQANPGRIIRGLKSMTEIRKDGYQNEHSMAIIMTAVIVALLLITGLGIVGLASFWVTQRTKQIGTRRALGATRPNVARYFLVENFIISAFGIALGTLLAIGLNVFLVSHFQMAKMSWYYLPIGALIVWMLGQLAVLGPATRASRVSPAVATRGV